MDLKNKGKKKNNKNKDIKEKKEKKNEESADNQTKINENSDAELKTIKKDFMNKVEPHNLKRLIQKEKCIWFGVHNELLRNKNMIKLIEKCKDKSLPIESAAIHLDKFKVSFDKNRVVINNDENSAILFKLYLITKEQLIDILKISFFCNDSINSQKIKFSKAKINDDINLSSYQTKGNCFFDILKCVGELDGINIFTVTAKKSQIEPPDNEYLKVICTGLIKTFHPYSEYLIMYYIYLIDGVKNFFSLKQLGDIFFQNKLNNNGFEHVSSISSETNLTIGEVQNQNKLLGIFHSSKSNKNNNNVIINNRQSISNKISENNSSNKQSSIKICNSPKDLEEIINSTPKQNIQSNETETVKCSTCNGSPFICTAEKNQLNQYSYIFDLHYLPIFDENTGEFFWDNNEALINNNSNKEKYNGNEGNIIPKSLVSLSNELSLNENSLGEVNNSPKKEGDKINNSGTFIEELNDILKEIK